MTISAENAQSSPKSACGDLNLTARKAVLVIDALIEGQFEGGEIKRQQEYGRMWAKTLSSLGKFQLCQ